MNGNLILEILPEKAERTKNVVYHLIDKKNDPEGSFNALEFYSIIDIMRRELRNESLKERLNGFDPEFQEEALPGELASYKHKSYDMDSISAVLKYIEENDITILEASRLFHVSRNTIATWKKKYSHHQ